MAWFPKKMDEDLLHDIPDPAPWLPGMEIPWWVWAVAVLAAATVVAMVLARHFRTPAGPAGDSSLVYDESRQRLTALKERLPGPSLAEVATDASLTLRGYLAETLEEPALFETHEEYLSRHDALEKLPSGSRERLAPLLEQLAEIKYGRSAPGDATALQLVDNSLEVLDGLESTRVRVIA